MTSPSNKNQNKVRKIKIAAVDFLAADGSLKFWVSSHMFPTQLLYVIGPQQTSSRLPTRTLPVPTLQRIGSDAAIYNVLD